MKPIRHLIAIVFLLCGLTARGSERGYDHDDMVGTYKYNEHAEYVLDLHLHSDGTFMVVSTECDASCRHFGKWDVKDELVILNFDRQEALAGQSQTQPQSQARAHSELDKYVVKELEILDKDRLFWGHHLQDGYEKRIELQRSDGDGASSSNHRKAIRNAWKIFVEQALKVIAQ